MRRATAPQRPGLAASASRTLRRFFGLWLLAKLAALAILIGGIEAAQHFATSSQFQVAEIVISGNELVAAEDISAALNVEGTNVFAVRGRRIERQLRADPAVESARISPRLPDQVGVLIRERLPVVVWEASGRTLLADVDGVALRDGRRDGLPVIHAPDGPAPDPGGRVDPDAVHMARALAPRLDIEGLGGGQLEYRPTNGGSVILPDSARVAFGSPDDLDDKLAAYHAIRSFLDQNRRHAELIDVRFLERPYFR